MGTLIKGINGHISGKVGNTQVSNTVYAAETIIR